MDVILDSTKDNPHHVSIVAQNIQIFSEEANTLNNLFK